MTELWVDRFYAAQTGLYPDEILARDWINIPKDIPVNVLFPTDDYVKSSKLGSDASIPILSILCIIVLTII
jgi:hypothetical protein